MKVTESELKTMKERKFNQLRVESDLDHVSDDDLHKMVDTFYKYEIKFEFLEIIL